MRHTQPSHQRKQKRKEKLRFLAIILGASRGGSLELPVIKHVVTTNPASDCHVVHVHVADLTHHLCYTIAAGQGHLTCKQASDRSTTMLLMTQCRGHNLVISSPAPDCHIVHMHVADLTHPLCYRLAADQGHSTCSE